MDTWNTNVASPIRKVVPLGSAAKKQALALQEQLKKVPEKPKLSAEELRRLEEERQANYRAERRRRAAKKAEEDRLKELEDKQHEILVQEMRELEE